MLSKSLRRSAGLFTLFSVIACGVSCQSANRAFKAKPAIVTSFMEDRANLRMMNGNGPFHVTWTAASESQLEYSGQKRAIYVAPVDTRHLRPVRSTLAKWERGGNGGNRPIEAIAAAIRAEFIDAFRRSENSRYRVVSSPASDSLTLKIALIELNPTSVTGNAARQTAGLFFGGLAGVGGMAAGSLTYGSIAIEGQLRDSETGWLIFQFADREKDKMSYVSVRDFRPYGHSEVAIEEWAEQFERLIRSPNWRTMRDSSFVTLNPF